MRHVLESALAVTAAMLIAGVSSAHAQDAARAISKGGILVAGWEGQISLRAREAGRSLKDAKLAAVEDALHVTTGPAVTYWKAGSQLTGSYTVRATFTEPHYMNLNNHPHPYGIVIAGNDMGTDRKSYLYCAAYGNGRYIVRGFGPEPFQLNGRRPDAHPAVDEAESKGEPVTQEIAISVTDDAVECAINGTVVASYPRAEVVTDGRLASTDGAYGIRFAHNTEAIVADLTVTRN